MEEKELRKAIVVSILILLLFALLKPVSTYALSSSPDIEENSKGEALLEQTVTMTFNASYKEDYYILNITDPGVYLFNLTATLIQQSYIWGVHGYCEIYSSAKIYSPFFDKNVTTRNQIAYGYFWMKDPGDTDSMYRKFVFVNTGVFMVSQHWYLYEEDVVEVEFTVRKLASLSEAEMLNMGVNSFTWTEEETTRMYKLNIEEPGLYNVTLRAQVPYNVSDPTKLLAYATLIIYTDWIYPDENLTVYLNNHSIGVITNGDYFSLDVDLSYVVLNGNNNLTFVYSGPYSVYIYWAELEVVDVFEYSKYTWFDINQEVSATISVFSWFYWRMIVRPFSDILFFDEEHGIRRYVDYYIRFYLASYVSLPGAGILNLTDGRILYLFSKNYYFSLTSGKFKMLNTSYITLDILIEKMDVPILNGGDSAFLEFNTSDPTPKFALIQLSPDKYHELSLSITKGGNVSVKAYVYSTGLWYWYYWYPQMSCLTVNSPTNNMSYEERVDLKNAISLTFLGFEPNWDLTGSTFFKDLNIFVAERLYYENNTPMFLGEPQISLTVGGFIFLRIDTYPIYYWRGYYLTPSENVTVKLSLNITGNIETISPGHTITFDTNTTMGPTYRVFKLDAECGSIYTINATPLEYGERGFISIITLPTSIEDWYLYYYREFEYAEAVNSSAILDYISVFNSSVYIFVEVTEYPGYPEFNGTSKVVLSVEETKPTVYEFGTTETLSLNGMKVYQFDVIKNYTYVITVKPKYDLTSLRIDFVDERGNFPFKGLTPYPPSIYINFPGSEASYYFIANGNSIAYLILNGEGTVSFEISYIKSYETGYEEGYQEGFGVGNETGFNEGNSTGYREGYETGYEEGYQKGSEEGYIAGRNFGIIVGISSGLIVGIVLTLIAAKRRSKNNI